MERVRNITVLGSFYYYYQHCQSHERKYMTEQRYKSCYSPSERIMTWEQIEEWCKSNKKCAGHPYPVSYLYGYYVEYLEIRCKLGYLFDDPHKKEVSRANLHDDADLLSEIVQDFSHNLADKKNSPDKDIVIAALSSCDLSQEKDMASILDHLERNYDNPDFIELLRQAGVGVTSAEFRERAISELSDDPQGLGAHELREIHRTQTRLALRSSYNRGFIFGTLFSLYRMSHSIHQRFSQPKKPAARKIVSLLSSRMRHEEVTIKNRAETEELLEFSKSRGKRNSSMARLLHERKKLREFVVKLRDTGAIKEDDYTAVISEIRPERERLHKHFKSRVQERFKLSIRSTKRLQEMADMAPVYGYVSSGAMIKLLNVDNHALFCVMTHDSNDLPCLTTAYNEDMFKKAGGIQVEHMNNQQRELYAAD
jgi:hypothetical protein